MSQLRICVGATLAFSYLFLFCPDSVQAYRPFNGTDGDVADLGEFELELGPVQLLREEGRNYLRMPATVLNFGILPRTELVIDFVGNLPLHRAQGDAAYAVQDTDVFLKVLLVKGALQEDAGPGPSIALEAGPLTPEFGGQPGFGAAANLIISERWKALLLHLNNEFALSRRDLNPVWSESLITELRVSEVIWPVTELLWERDMRTGGSLYSALVGAIWSVADGFDLDAAAVALNIRGQPAFEGRLGFTWAFPMWKSGSEAEEEENPHEQKDPT
jgi:hypothetical protein